MLLMRICAAYIVSARPPSLATSSGAVICVLRLPTRSPSDQPARKTNS